MTRLLNHSNSDMNELTQNLLDIQTDDQILEVGFGGGALLSNIADASPTTALFGVDFSSDMVATGKAKLKHVIAKGQLQIEHASVDNIPYENNAFSKICCVNTVYFWENCAAAFGELSRVCKEGGLLIVTFSDASSLDQQSVTRHGFNLYSLANVQQMMEAAGFTISHVREARDSTGKFNAVVARLVGSVPEN